MDVKYALMKQYAQNIGTLSDEMADKSAKQWLTLTQSLPDRAAPGELNRPEGSFYSAVGQTISCCAMRSTTVLLVFAVLLGLPGRADDKVKTQTTPGIDFAQYRTYQWLPPRVLAKTGVVENHPASPLIREAVDRQLIAKGLTQVNEAGDLQVAATVLTESIPQVEAVLLAGPDNMMYGAPIATMGRYNKQGTLVVNLIDAKTKKSSWIGLAREDLPGDREQKPEVVRKKLDSAAKKMFKKYPKTKPPRGPN
jgi:hypothetical protein